MRTDRTGRMLSDWLKTGRLQVHEPKPNQLDCRLVVCRLGGLLGVSRQGCMLEASKLQTS